MAAGCGGERGCGRKGGEEEKLWASVCVSARGSVRVRPGRGREGRFWGQGEREGAGVMHVVEEEEGEDKGERERERGRRLA